MEPDQLTATLKEAILRKEVRLKQGRLGVVLEESTRRYEADGDCQCVLGAWLLGQTLSDSDPDIFSTTLSIPPGSASSIAIGFDLYPHSKINATFYNVGYSIAAWADELGILER